MTMRGVREMGNLDSDLCLYYVQMEMLSQHIEGM